MVSFSEFKSEQIRKLEIELLEVNPSHQISYQNLTIEPLLTFKPITNLKFCQPLEMMPILFHFSLEQSMDYGLRYCAPEKNIPSYKRARTFIQPFH